MVGIESSSDYAHNVFINNTKKDVTFVPNLFTPQLLTANLTIGTSPTDSDNKDNYHNHGFVAVLGLSITMVICMVLALVGNFLVIMTVLRHKGMRTRTNMFIVNLAVADILVAIFNMPLALITVINGRWIFGELFCQFIGFINPLFLITSIQTLMCISIHKYISITRPFSQFMTNRKIQVMIVISWLWAAVCAIFTVKIGNHIVYKIGSSQCGPSIPDELNEHIHSISITTFNYILPLVVMCFCYFNIFREIHEHMTRIRMTSNIDLQNTLNQQRKITCTLFSVLSCFIVCWTPYIIYSSSAAFSTNKDKIPLIANPIAYWCGYMNSACNPIIYALRSPSFRQGYKEIICHYQAYNLDGNNFGNFFSKPSLSPYGTIKVISSRTSTQLINNGHLDVGTKSICNGRKFSLEKRSSKKSGKTSMNTKSSNYTNLSSFLKPELNLKSVRQNRMRSYSLQANINEYTFEKYRVIQTFSKLKPNLVKYHSVPNDINNCTSYTTTVSQKSENDSNRDDLNDECFIIETIHPSQLDQFEMGHSPSCPFVIVDKTPAQTSMVSGHNNVEKNNGDASITGTFHENYFVNDNYDVGKWSPVSIKSLEMGRNRRPSFKFTMRKSSNATIKMLLGKPESPLYSASKEQLMKWMSEDCLDITEKRVFSFDFSQKLFSSFRSIRNYNK